MMARSVDDGGVGSVALQFIVKASQPSSAQHTRPKENLRIAHLVRWMWVVSIIFYLPTPNVEEGDTADRFCNDHITAHRAPRRRGPWPLQPSIDPHVKASQHKGAKQPYNP